MAAINWLKIQAPPFGQKNDISSSQTELSKEKKEKRQKKKERKK
jgi:hypothetical protein